MGRCHIKVGSRVKGGFENNCVSGRVTDNSDVVLEGNLKASSIKFAYREQGRSEVGGLELVTLAASRGAAG